MIATSGLRVRLSSSVVADASSGNLPPVVFRYDQKTIELLGWMYWREGHAISRTRSRLYGVDRLTP